MESEIVEAIKGAEIDCPDCEYMSSAESAVHERLVINRV